MSLDDLQREIRHAGRALLKRPLFSALTIATLAVGIGASTAGFTLLDSVVFRPLPVHEPDRLVQLASVDPQGRGGYIALGALDLIERERIFEGTCAFLTPQSTVAVDGRVGAMAALALFGHCFTVLAIRPAAGRLFGPADDVAGAPNVVVLSYDMWQREFGGDSAAIGRGMTIEGEPFTIVGVAEPKFRGLQIGFPSRLMVPLGPRAFLPASLRGLMLGVNVFARLSSGVSIAQATARMQTLWPAILENSVPAGYQERQRAAYLASRLRITPAGTGLDSIFRTRFRFPLTALLGIAVIVLAVSCVNVANLLLARAFQRRREHSIRAAIGASRMRLVREAAAETALLLVPAVAIGVWLAHAAVDLLVSVYAATSRNFGLDVAPDLRTLAFVCGAACLAWACFALGPVLAVGGAPPAAALATSSFGNTARQGGTRRALLVAQVALTMVLVVCAAWFAATLRALRTTPAGFEIEGLVSARLTPLPGGYDTSFESSVYYRQLVETIEALPGVQSAALSNAAPPAPPARRETVAASDRPDAETEAQALRVSDRFFETLRLPLAAGTDFSRADRRTGSRTAIVSQSLARRLFEAGDPIGRSIRVGTLPADQVLQIVGVAADAVIGDPRSSDQPVVYLNYWQQDAGFQQFPVLLVRSDAPLGKLAATMRAEIARGGREYALTFQRSIDSRDNVLIQERLLSMTSVLFGAIGLLLTAVGLFGLLSVTVASRTKEFGIRLAVGATRGEVFRLVLRDTLASLTMGIAAGLPLVWAARRLLSALLHGLGPWIFVALLGSVAVIVVVGLAAAWLPANRATKIDPLTALRVE